MSKIVLIEPPSTMQKLQSIKSRRPHLGAPLPYVYIGSYLQEAGIPAEVIDMRINSTAYLRDYLRDNKPALAGITIMPGNALRRSIALNKLIKKYSPHTKIVWGGSFPSLHYELCLNIPEVDFVVSGDGEETLTELASLLGNGHTKSDLVNIKGLVFRENGSYRVTEPRPPTDLNRKPVGAWNLLEKNMNFYLGPNKYLAVNTTRGCPFKCSFCYNNLLYKGFKRFRIRAIEQVLQEIDFLQDRYKLNKIQFMDDDFLGHRPRGLKLAQAIHDNYPGLTYHIAARVDELTDENTVRHLSETGCRSVFLGVESGSTEILNDINKGCSANDTIEAAKLCKKYNINATYSFACGFPDENWENLRANIELAIILRQINKHSQSTIEIISPIANTPLYQELQEREQLPDSSPASWCYLTDWKSAHNKPWIENQEFYEAFQLAFFLAFASEGSSAGLRSLTRVLSDWARRRLVGNKPHKLPEFCLMNYIIKKAIWGIM